MKEKVVIFGTGSTARKAVLSASLDQVEIVAYLDNKEEKQGQYINGIPIVSPNTLDSLEYSKIIVCSVAFKDICKQLVHNYGISRDKIENHLYFIKKDILKDYELHQDEICGNNELSLIYNALYSRELRVFNYDFNEKYDDVIVDVAYDKLAEMYYVIHNGKRMYFKRDFRTVDEVTRYYKFLLVEQDEKSPHRYANLTVDKGSIVIDAGVAEGNFALDIIDKVDKIYLIEADAEWIEALRYTFGIYSNKVVLINKFLTNYVDNNHITLDFITENQAIDYIKMDIEGDEIRALQGAEKLLERSSHIKFAVCSYHHYKDETDITCILSKHQFKTSTSHGYMLWWKNNIYETKHLIRPVKGLVYGIK